jgi:OPT family oligopeptide transporter
MSSAASAAGYMSSAGLVSAFPALLLATDRSLTGIEMMTWLSAISFLGVFMAIPLKRQLINVDKLPFPTGLATAETLKSMHTEGAEAMAKAKSLLVGGVIGALLVVWRDIPPLIGKRYAEMNEGVAKLMTRIAFPEEIPLLPSDLGRELLSRYTLGYEGSLLMVAAGAIMGIRVGLSILLGALIYYGPIAYWLYDTGIVSEPGYKPLVTWTVWPATAMMVTSGLLAFAMRWRTVVRSFGSLATLFGGKQNRRDDPMAAIEVPGSWFLIGTALCTVACIVLGEYFFGIAWWMGAIAVAMTFLLSIVAARATGETDITPIGAMGKITQLTYGVLAPSNITTNLLTASITAGASSHSADLLTDLKSGYLLGGNPRMQTISQLFGVLAGTFFCVPVYMVIVSKEKLESGEFPAPAARTWESVARLLANGVDALPQYAVHGMVIGGVIGILITLAESLLPKRYARWVPSATGLGIAGVVPGWNGISMFLGALVAWLVEKSSPRLHEKYTITVSSGMIAGESLLAVFIKLWVAAPLLWSELMKKWNDWIPKIFG